MEDEKYYDLMCELCYKGGIEIGHICSNFSLILWEGKYHILAGQGHAGDIIHTFQNKPTVDPDPECVHTGTPEALPGEAEFDACFEELVDLKLDMETGYAFVAGCKDPNCCDDPWSQGIFANWLVNRCGKMILEHENGKSVH